MRSFVLGGIHWRVIFVDPNSTMLIDRTGSHTVATTDPVTNTVYLSRELGGEFLTHVLIHELGHCVIVSFHLQEDIRRMVRPEYWIEAEEWVCNFIADYGMMIFESLYHVLGDDALQYLPYELSRLIA